jgi:uncharacterized membrane protein
MVGGDDKLAFLGKLLLAPFLLIALLSLPLALGRVPPNGVYGFRTEASLASAAVWYRSNHAAGVAGVVLGLAGALLIHAVLRVRPLDARRILVAAGILLFVAFATAAAGLLAS